MAKEHYLIRLNPPREGFAENADEREREIIGKHFEYLQGLHKAGEVLMAGRTDDASMGLVVLEVDSEARAKEIMASDPAVAGMVFTATLKPFRLALLSGRE